MPAPMFPANAHRYDPYRTFKVQVVIGGQTVASFTSPVDISGTGGIQVVVDDTGTPVTITA